MKPEDGPWISLPSKQYPNEVYYFNVSTGMSNWEKPKTFCEPVNDSTNLQCLAKPTTPERTKNSSYIVESLSPSSSPKKLLQNVNKPTPEIQQKEGREKRKRIILQRNRSQIKEHLSRKCVDVKKKPTKDAIEVKCKPDRNSKNDLFQPVPKLPKPNNEIINKTAVEDRLQSAERKSCDSGVTSQKSSHSGQSNEKFPQETMWEQRKKRDSQNPDLVRGRCETVLRRCKVPDVPVVCGAASERLERLKKQLREDRLKKCQRPQTGRKCDNESSRNIRTDSSFDVQQRKPVESVCYNMPSNYTTSLRNEKAIETGCKGTEVISSWEWSSQGFVREYNHKSITDNGQQSADTYEKCISRGKVMGSTSEKTMRGRINTHGDSAISALPNKSSQLGHLSCYSGRNVERLFLPRKTSQPGCSVAKNFEQNESELEKRVKNEIGNKKIGSDVDYHLSYSNSNPNTSEQSKNSLINNTSLRNMLKQKSHNSKGGITKINRRVQKQVRTAAPKLVHLPSSSVRNILESSQKSKSVDPNCTSVHPVKLMEDEEEMDWEPIEPEKVVMHVEALRKEGGFQNIVNPELVNLCNMDNEMSSQWFVVLDTNVLLSHLAFLRALRDTKDTELGMPTLFIPWVVLQELDHLKSTNKKAALQNYARRAINFIYDNLLNKHPRVGGQPKAEADEYDALEPDDSILQCSLNLQKRSSKVLLLTNDRNLFNKAIVNGVECCSAPKLLQELETRRKLSTPSTSSFGILDDSELPFHTTVQTVKQCIGVVLEELLRTEMVMVYDRDWSEIVSRKPPWTLNDILFCILKHWVAVFRLVLPSAARELIEKIRTFVNNEVYETSLESVKNLVKTCISLMHLVSSLSYKQYVDNAVKTLNELQCSLKVHTKLPTPSCVTLSSAATGKANNARSIISGTSQLDDSDATSVTSKGEKNTQSIGIGIDSREDCDGGNSIGDSKIDADDCLSLFASTFSEDTGNTHLSDGSVEKGQELTHKYLNKIWEKIAVYCGMLCDVMGVEPCVPYQLPEPFPAVETLHRNMLSFVKCVSTLLRCMEGILLSQPTELRENSPIILNFYNTIKESLPIWNELEEALLPQHVLAYCTQTDTRQQLDHGKKQFEQFEAVLNRAVTFFMGQNQSLTSLPSF